MENEIRVRIRLYWSMLLVALLPIFLYDFYYFEYKERIEILAMILSVILPKVGYYYYNKNNSVNKNIIEKSSTFNRRIFVYRLLSVLIPLIFDLFVFSFTSSILSLICIFGLLILYFVYFPTKKQIQLLNEVSTEIEVIHYNDAENKEINEKEERKKAANQFRIIMIILIAILSLFMQLILSLHK